MKQLNVKKLVLLNLPYILLGLFATNLGEAWRLATGADASAKMLSFFSTLPVALGSWWPSLHPLDLAVGLCCGAALRLAVYLKGKNAKKYRHNVEYGSARWGTHEDIAPYIDPVFQNNVILTQTERLTMSSRPKNPKYARNKNVLVIGGSGSGKTRFWLKPNLMQMHSSYVVTDPKGTILVECGKMLQRGAPKLGKDGKPVKDKHGKIVYEPCQIKVLNTINFKKSMHYNPFSYIHSEKDILKLVTTLIANTKGEGKAGDDFWVKAETLLYCALIGYIHYEAPVEEQNFSTLIEMINSMEVREDDEEFKNAVDLMFDELKEREPNHFAVRQYAKYKLAAGKTAKESREQFQALLAECRAGNIEMVITKSISRFARNTVTLLNTVRELKDLGIDVYFEEQNIRTLDAEGEILLTLLASFAQEESLSVSENCKWRIRNGFAEGRAHSCTMLGYRLVDGEITLVEDEAETVKYIFDLYLAGNGLQKIANTLNEEGRWSINGNIWRSGTIRKVLTNEKYCGDLLLQKCYRENHITKKTLPNKGELK